MQLQNKKLKKQKWKQLKQQYNIDDIANMSSSVKPATNTTTLQQQTWDMAQVAQ